MILIDPTVSHFCSLSTLPLGVPAADKSPKKQAECSAQRDPPIYTKTDLENAAVSSCTETCSKQTSKCKFRIDCCFGRQGAEDVAMLNPCFSSAALSTNVGKSKSMQFCCENRQSFSLRVHLTCHSCKGCFLCKWGVVVTKWRQTAFMYKSAQQVESFARALGKCITQNKLIETWGLSSLPPATDVWVPGRCKSEFS